MITQIKYPSRARGLLMAVLFSVLAHVVILLAIRIAPIVRFAMGFQGLEYVEEPYDKRNVERHIRLQYPPGYLGFRAPKKTSSLDEMKKEEARRKKEEARRKREQELAKNREAEERAKPEEKARAELPNAEPTQSDYGSFGKINTAPI